MIIAVNGESRTPSFPTVPPEGLFGPGSMIWKINRERVVLLGGPAAAILQIAHPKIARGVLEHSDFRRDALGRLKRTLAAVYTVAFGTGEEVARTARAIAKLHHRIRGDALANGSGQPPSPQPPEEPQQAAREAYSAFDADLQLWVVATLVITAVEIFESFVEPLTPEEKQRYLEEMRRWGEFFGLDRNFGPQRWPEFQAYWREMLEGGILGSHPESAGLTRAIVRPETPWWLWLATAPTAFLSTEIVPPPLREKLGLHSHRWTRAAWRITRCTLPPLCRLLPGAIRFAAPYRKAVARRR